MNDRLLLQVGLGAAALGILGLVACRQLVDSTSHGRICTMAFSTLQGLGIGMILWASLF